MAEKKDVKRYKCINFGACTKADQGAIIEIPTIETLGGTPPCPHCKQQTLEEIVVKPINWKLYGGIAAAVAVLGCGGAWLALGGGGEQKTDNDSVTAVDTVRKDTAVVEKKDTVKPAEIVKPEAEQPTSTTTSTTRTKPVEVQNGTGTKVFSYGKYTGGLKNGQPDGTGKLTFTQTYQLNAEYTAQPGEYIQGIFENGKPTFVTYYQNDGTVTKIKLR